MYHAVARYTKPCQIGNLVDSINRKPVIYMVTMLWDDFRKVFAAAFTFSFVPVVSIFTIHKVLKIRFPALTLCIGRQSKVLWTVNGGTVARQRLMLVSVIHISSSPILRVWSHFLVKWLAFIFAVSNESHSNTEPFSVNFYSESFTVVTLMPMRQIAELL